MAAGNTYTQIASTTLGSAAATVTFSSIPGTYTDLVLLTAASNTGGNGNGLAIQFNTDTASNYSKTYLYGDGTSVVSGRGTSQTNISISNMPISSTGVFGAGVANIQNYSNATTYKTVVSRGGAANTGMIVIAYVGLWRSTAAITTITLFSDTGNLATGSTFSLYGITAA
jgi:hypothetical protein